MENKPLLYRDKYLYRPRNNYYNIKLITISGNCSFNDCCKHDVKIEYTNNTNTTLTLDKIEYYDLLIKCGIPDEIIEKHFRIEKNKKLRCLKFFCCK